MRYPVFALMLVLAAAPALGATPHHKAAARTTGRQAATMTPDPNAGVDEQGQPNGAVTNAANMAPAEPGQNQMAATPQPPRPAPDVPDVSKQE